LRIWEFVLVCKKFTTGGVTMSRKFLVLLIVGLFLISMPSRVWAQGGGPDEVVPPAQEDEIIGSVFSEPVRSQPSRESGKGVAPNSSYSCWGQVGLQWNALRMEALSTTGIVDAGTSLYLRARVRQFLRDGNPVLYVGSDFADGWYSGTAQITALVKAYGWVYGHTWWTEAGHAVTDFGSFDWNDISSVGVTL